MAPKASAGLESDQISLLEIGRRAAWQAERQAIQETLVQNQMESQRSGKKAAGELQGLLNKIRQIEEEDPTQKGKEKNLDSE